MKRLKEKIETWFAAVAFAEAGEPNMAMEIVGTRSVLRKVSVEDAFAAVAFAEAGCPDSARALDGGGAGRRRLPGFPLRGRPQRGASLVRFGPSGRIHGGLRLGGGAQRRSPLVRSGPKRRNPWTTSLRPRAPEAFASGTGWPRSPAEGASGSRQGEFFKLVSGYDATKG